MADAQRGTGASLPAGFVEAYLRELDRVRRVTVETARLVPAEVWDASPAPAVMTVRELLAHVLDVEEATMDGVVTGHWRFGRPENAAANLAGFDDFARRSAEVRAATARALVELGGAGLWREMITPFGFGGPALFLVDSARENEVHHRAQIFVLLRQRGLKPPWLYGEEGQAHPSHGRERSELHLPPHGRGQSRLR